LYRAEDAERGEVVGTAPAVIIPLSELGEATRRSLALLILPRGILAAGGGASAVISARNRVRALLASDGLKVVEMADEASGDFMATAAGTGADLFLLIEIDGEKKYTDYGNIIAHAAAAARLYRMPGGEVIWSANGRKSRLSTSDADGPMRQAVEGVIVEMEEKILSGLR